MVKKQSRQTTHELQFNVAQLLKESTGATRHYEVKSQILNELDNDVSVVAPIEGRVQFMHTGPQILVTGLLQTNVEMNCGRCLTPFVAPVSLELEEIFFPTIDVTTGTVMPTPEDADEANRINDQHILDLFEVVRQGLLLESDTTRYCRPDCKGLCPHCGQDKNSASCNCEEDVIDVRWAGLLELELD